MSAEGLRNPARLAATAAAAAALLVLLPDAALAHGLQSRTDLPIPIAAFYWAAGGVLAASFVALGILWSEPRFAEVRWRPAPRWVQLLRAPKLLWAVRIGVLLWFLLVLAAAAFGVNDPRQNIAPTALYVFWWVGLVPLAVLFGNVWREINPWSTLARLARIPTKTAHSYPSWSVGIWPTIPVLLMFTWTELAYPMAEHLPALAVLILLYTAWVLGGMTRYGRDVWLDHAEAFTVFSRLFARLSPFELRTVDGMQRVGLRPPLVAAASTRAKPGLVLFVTLTIGTVSFDGLSRTTWYAARGQDAGSWLIDLGSSAGLARTLVGTVGLLAMCVVAFVAYELAVYASDRVGGLEGRLSSGRIADAFAHTLIPIGCAYAVAHYFSYFIFQSQDLIRLASDPFGTGADLFGTLGFSINYNWLPGDALWYVQVGAIVIGHVAGLVLAHDRALQLAEHSRKAVRSQYCMLALMLLYTVGGLYFLSEGLNG